jgi:hypothetical protein
MHATPFYYAAKAMYDTPEPAVHPRPLKSRRRRIRRVLFPAFRTTVPTATPSTSR